MMMRLLQFFGMVEKTMVILSKPYGGLSNRLFQHIHLNSFCLENRIRFANFFLGPLGTPALPTGAALALVRDAFRAIGLAKCLRFEAEGADYALHETSMKSDRLVFVEGWTYRNLQLTRQHRDFYRRTLYEENPPVEPRKILRADRIRIAVHIRRGDYASWLGGRYFYPDSVYFAAINQILGFIRSDHQILIFTDDPSLDRAAFKARYGEVFFSSFKARSDHYLMSFCDYIVGPPSTFSMWASYIGAARYCHIENPTDQVCADSFAVCDG